MRNLGDMFNTIILGMILQFFRKFYAESTKGTIYKQHEGESCCQDETDPEKKPSKEYIKEIIIR